MCAKESTVLVSDGTGAVAAALDLGLPYCRCWWSPPSWDFFAWRAWRAPESTEPLRAVPLTTLPGVQRYPSFSPDGNHVAFTWTGPKQDNPDIYVQQIGAGSPLRLTTDPSNDYNPVWSPDGRWIAFLRSQSEAGKSELRLIPPLGGPERKLAEIRVRDGLASLRRTLPGVRTATVWWLRTPRARASRTPCS